MAKKERVTYEHNYRNYSGIVITKHNYGTKEKPDWYIEFREDYLGYKYIKQQLDGLSNVEFIFTEEE